MQKSAIKKVYFCNDFMRLDDTRGQELYSPSDVNLHWFASLFGHVPDRLNVPSIIFDPKSVGFSRNEIYHLMGRIPSTASWARVFEGGLPPVVQQAIADAWRDAFVFLFEAPPYLINLLNEEGIPYIDFTIHPIRFLDDYVFGVRTNQDDVRGMLKKFTVPEEYMKSSARLSKSLTQRRILNSKLQLPSGSVVFFGQTSVDASLISNGKMVSDIAVEIEIAKLANEFGSVYYKSHPHAKNQKWVEGLVRRNPNVTLLDRNVYDVLGDKNVSLVAAMSSSVLNEAVYFGLETRRLLDRPSNFLTPGVEEENFHYFPISGDCLEAHFWDVIFNEVPIDEGKFYLSRGNGQLKSLINMKWGR